MKLNSVFAASIRDIVPAIPYALSGPMTEVQYPARDPAPLSAFVCSDWLTHRSGLDLFEQYGILPNQYDFGDAHNLIHAETMRKLLKRRTQLVRGVNTLLQNTISKHLSR